jgi:hypothetical protein
MPTNENRTVENVKSPLHGIMTTFGSIAEDGYVPKRYASAIARLKASGGIVLAKTACPTLPHRGLAFLRRVAKRRNPVNSRHNICRPRSILLQQSLRRSVRRRHLDIRSSSEPGYRLILSSSAFI